MAERDGDRILIRCRHCKRYVVIETKGINSITFQDMVEPAVEKTSPSKPLRAERLRAGRGLSLL